MHVDVFGLELVAFFDLVLDFNLNDLWVLGAMYGEPVVEIVDGDLVHVVLSFDLDNVVVEEFQDLLFAINGLLIPLFSLGLGKALEGVGLVGLL